ncbi:polysaccharide deacetylase family protein [Arthrobacter sp. L77]|uniref:polysaccharide deacetylase family protein n=1 Tax=Arthrobacter sp. L77 TaxID=1496689 RepID=UPI00068D36F7|nr:polysaccharide deacetylase family protein [Arthrobacter sp. L77]
MSRAAALQSRAAIAVLMLALTGCAGQEPLPPTPIPRVEVPAGAADMSQLPELTAPATCAGYVALTFDDGPTELTSDLRAVLDHYEIPGVFFNTGAQEQARPREVERTKAAGHQLGNHSMTHPDLLAGDLTAALADIDAATVVHRDLGHDAPTLFRPPYGSTSSALRAAVESRGMLEVLWTVDSKDFEAGTAEQVVEQSKGMTDGGILLLHDGKPLTVEALPRIIEHYYAQDLCFGEVVAADTELPTDVGLTHRARATKQEP